MLNRIFNQTLLSVALVSSLAATGCGTSSSVSTVPDEIPSAPPRILTGMIIEMPEGSEAIPDQSNPVETPQLVVDAGVGVTKEIGESAAALKNRPSRPAETAAVDNGVRPATAAEASPIPTVLANTVATEVGNVALTRPQLPAPRPLVRTPRMVAVIQQAEEHNRQGFTLASRGACFSARAEFIQALRGISQGLDTETRSADYGRALSAGMRALEEAEDFIPRGARLNGEIDVAMLVRAHRTPVLRAGSMPAPPPATAALFYQKYAVEQLSTAIAGEAAGSLALHSLGKLYGLFAQDATNTTVDPQGKAIVFQRAAFRADPNNYLAANELAVLLAQQGAYVPARDLLLRAISISARPAMWHNLAVVHAKLGELELAALAERTALSSAGGANPGNVQAMAALQAVRWVDPATFTQLSPPPADLNPAPPGAKPQEPAPSTAAPATTGPGSQKGMSRWAPWGTRQQ